jgi:hypothetical protein
MAAVIGPPTLADADVDYTFAQVAVERLVVDLGANCGNLSSAVGPFAVDQRRCPRADGPALVRVHNTNTGGLIHARFAVSGGCAETRGDMAIPGVAGTGAPDELEARPEVMALVDRLRRLVAASDPRRRGAHAVDGAGPPGSARHRGALPRGGLPRPRDGRAGAGRGTGRRRQPGPGR